MSNFKIIFFYNEFTQLKSTDHENAYHIKYIKLVIPI